MRRVLGLQEAAHGSPEGPSVKVWSGRSPQERERVANYLEAGGVLAATGRRALDVVTGEDVTVLALLTDGEWSWYSDLAHHVRAYDVALPSEFEQRARAVPPPRLDAAALLTIAQRETAAGTRARLPAVPGAFVPGEPYWLLQGDARYEIVGVDDDGAPTVRFGVREGAGDVWAIGMGKKKAVRRVSPTLQQFVASLQATGEVVD